MERGEGWLSAIIERRGLDREGKRERERGRLPVFVEFFFPFGAFRVLFLLR